MLETLHLWELPYIQAFQKAMDIPFFDFFFRAITLFDDKRMVAAVVVLVWIFAGWRWGAVSAFLLILSWTANVLLKNLLEQPRPFLLDPSIAHNAVTNFYGLPSGAAQTAFILAALLIYANRSLWAWILGVIFALSLSFSRIYVGVHFFSDLIGGWIIGGVHFFFNLFARQNPWI